MFALFEIKLIMKIFIRFKFLLLWYYLNIISRRFMEFVCLKSVGNKYSWYFPTGASIHKNNSHVYNNRLLFFFIWHLMLWYFIIIVLYLFPRPLTRWLRVYMFLPDFPKGKSFFYWLDLTWVSSNSFTLIVYFSPGVYIL